jgi:two-component system OmpR family response regulator
MGKVLLVDDDVELSSMLREYVAREGFDVDMVHDGEAGVRAALSGTYSIVVLDVMMPNDGRHRSSAENKKSEPGCRC